MNFNQLSKANGTELDEWLEVITELFGAENLDIPDAQNLRAYYHDNKTVMQVLKMSKQSESSSASRHAI